MTIIYHSHTVIIVTECQSTANRVTVWRGWYVALLRCRWPLSLLTQNTLRSPIFVSLYAIHGRQRENERQSCISAISSHQFQSEDVQFA